MTLELGDHVWYWNGNISLDKSIPRAQWFPGSNSDDPNDYQGHGREIYNYVIHADEIARGRPHMRNHEGSFAWLNNNPGNITGVPGGPDFGQYPGKFNWHNFLIFPTWAHGYNAIALLLRTALYVNLSILDAFKKYAPESDGNNPVAYANAVAAALSSNNVQVPVSTRVGDLDDGQMQVMQDKIQEIEGVIPGDSLSWDSDDIPPEIADQLPKLIRRARRPLGREGSEFHVALRGIKLKPETERRIDSEIRRIVMQELAAIDFEGDLHFQQLPQGVTSAESRILGPGPIRGMVVQKR
jgi:hypothetical protein